MKRLLSGIFLCLMFFPILIGSAKDMKISQKWLAVIKSDMGTDKIALFNEDGEMKYIISPKVEDSISIDVLSWSENGRFLSAGLYNRKISRWQVAVYDLIDPTHIPNPRMYGSPRSDIYNPVWHNETLAVIRQQDDTSSIWLVNIGGGLEELDSKWVTITDLAWSPNGDSIAFACSSKNWSESSTEMPDDTHICLWKRDSSKTESVPETTGARYPFWLHDTLSWIVPSKGEVITDNSQRRILFSDVHLNQIGTPLVNGNDIYVSTYTYQSGKDANVWHTLKFTCTKEQCVRSSIQYQNAYQLSLSPHGLYAFQGISDTGNAFVTIVKTGFGSEKHLLVGTGDVQYLQPAWQP